MKNKWISILLYILVVLLALGNLYFLFGRQDERLEVNIGIPGADGQSVDFTRSTPVTDSEQVGVVLLSLLYSHPAQEAEIPERSPDAVLWLQNASETYPLARLWLMEDSIISVIGKEGEEECRIIENNGNYEIFREILESQISRYA
ncbi:MAG TPA: hypothetical protein IAC31_01595 [Candidatus Faecousia intestinigallinarum]|nr:hypothetical protein [Candidatus Faecousia intestinigallinarum]